MRSLFLLLALWHAAGIVEPDETAALQGVGLSRVLFPARNLIPVCTRIAALDSSPPGELTPELFASAIDRGWYTYADRLIQIGHASDDGVSPDLYKALSEALDDAERRLKSSLDRTLDHLQKGRSAAAAESPGDAVGDGVSVVAPAPWSAFLGRNGGSTTL